jgi:hypothetical protein
MPTASRHFRLSLIYINNAHHSLATLGKNKERRLTMCITVG